MIYSFNLGQNSIPTSIVILVAETPVYGEAISGIAKWRAGFDDVVRVIAMSLTFISQQWVTMLVGECPGTVKCILAANQLWHCICISGHTVSITWQSDDYVIQLSVQSSVLYNHKHWRVDSTSAGMYMYQQKSINNPKFTTLPRWKCSYINIPISYIYDSLFVISQNCKFK